jgi:preprotein translocase subunit SecA
MILIRVVDNKWMDHIDAMDQLKHGIGLRALGQSILPGLCRGGFEMFDLMVKNIKEDTVKFCFNVTLQTNTAESRSSASAKAVKRILSIRPMRIRRVFGSGNASPPACCRG